MTLDDIKRIFNVNMFGTFLITKAVVEVMKEAKYGRIVSLSSVSAKRGGGVFGGAHYSASKAALLGFSKNLAREVAGPIVFLASTEAGYITGEDIDINGGSHMD